MRRAFIARGSEAVTLEGPPETDRVVLIEFPTREAAEQFYNSEEYRRIKGLREGAASAQFVVVDGMTAIENEVNREPNGDHYS